MNEDGYEHFLGKCYAAMDGMGLAIIKINEIVHC